MVEGSLVYPVRAFAKTASLMGFGLGMVVTVGRFAMSFVVWDFVRK